MSGRKAGFVFAGFLYMAAFLSAAAFAAEENDQAQPGTETEAVSELPGDASEAGGQADDGEVYVGIRPEGFILSDKGPFSCKLKSVEVMGRDTSIVSTHPACESVTIRSIVDAEDAKSCPTDVVRFELRPSKVHLFDVKTEERIRF